MAENAGDPRGPVDPRIDTAAREGLTGTAPANLYPAVADRDQITIPPDFAPMQAQPAWRHDFPIDWPQDQYVARRDFMKFMVLTSAAFALGQLWIAGENLWRRWRGLPPARRIGSVDDHAVGAAKTFNYPGEHDPCLLVRVSETGFVAFSQKCTHLSCAVIPRPEEGIFYCPCHEGRFDMRTGAPLAGPPRRPLSRIVLDFRGREIFAVDEQPRTA